VGTVQERKHTMRMKRYMLRRPGRLAVIVLVALAGGVGCNGGSSDYKRMETVIRKVDDFDLKGDGSAAAWKRADWLELNRLGEAKAAYSTRAKVVYSETGIYFLLDNEDTRITCTRRKDNDNIYEEDVVEAFIWPDESQNVYFEYEISPLGVELPLLVSNNAGKYFGWLPWHYEGKRKIRRATTIRGGPAKPGAAVKGWTAEFFIPFALFRGMGNAKPTPGMKWRANIYRIDYDGQETTYWAWSKLARPIFHSFREFGTFVFE